MLVAWLRAALKGSRVDCNVGYCGFRYALHQLHRRRVSAVLQSLAKKRTLLVHFEVEWVDLEAE